MSVLSPSRGFFREWPRVGGRGRGLVALPPHGAARCPCAMLGAKIGVRACSRRGLAQSRFRCCARAPCRCAPVAAAALRPPCVAPCRRRSRAAAASVALGSAPAVVVFCSGGGRLLVLPCRRRPRPRRSAGQGQGGGACLPVGRLKPPPLLRPRPPFKARGRGLWFSCVRCGGAFVRAAGKAAAQPPQKVIPCGRSSGHRSS